MTPPLSGFGGKHPLEPGSLLLCRQGYRRKCPPVGKLDEELSSCGLEQLDITGRHLRLPFPQPGGGGEPLRLRAQARTLSGSAFVKPEHGVVERELQEITERAA